MEQRISVLFQCVKQGKIDGFLLDIPHFSAVARTDPNLSYVTIPDYSVEIGIAFGKNATGQKLQAEMNEFLAALRADFDRSMSQLAGLGVPALAYPHGEYSDLAEQAARDAGFQITMTTETGINRITPGRPEDLRLLRRNMVTNRETGADLVAGLEAMAMQ